MASTKFSILPADNGEKLECSELRLCQAGYKRKIT
jgi:hypothetical protein